MVSQEDVAHVRTGQRVKLLLTGRSDRSMRGNVAEISPVPLESLPRELVATQLVPAERLAGGESRPLAPVYRVRVTLDKATGQPPLLGETGEARIRLAAEPLAYRCWRTVQQTFQFEL
ncbi:MAG: hypothetical protein R3B90_10525 [Planctomycetaceae bacterium]